MDTTSEYDSAPILTDEIRKEIDAIVAGLSPDASCIATGSIMEGFGNANSDIDLYVVLENGVPARSIAIGMRENRYVDCEYMTLSSLNGLRSRIDDQGWPSLLSQSKGDFDRYYRCCIGIPVVLTEATRSTLEAFRKETVCEAYAKWSLLRAHDLLSRATTAAALGLGFEADVLLREAALWSGCHRLAELGEGYPNPKWIGEKAARVYGRGSAGFDDIVDDYLRPQGTVAHRTARLRERIRLAAHPAALLGARACELGAGVAFVPKPGEGGAGYLVRAKQSVVELDPVAAAICEPLAAGAPWGAAAEVVADRLGLPCAEFAAAAWYATESLRTDSFLTALPRNEAARS